MRARGGGSLRRRFAAQAGFNLIEVSIASLVVGVLVASVLTTLVHGFSILSRSRQTLSGNQIAQQHMETIRTYTWAQMTNNTYFSATNTTDGNITYSIFRSVTNYSNSTTYGTNYLKKVTVTVTWTNAPGKVMSNQLTTVISQGGLNDYFF
jgi:prepilin-type N-terminal cleavage/methylation domain-containing protein